MVVEIPLRSSLDYYNLDVDLDGRTYTLALRWNSRAEAYFLTVSNADGDVILAGRRVVVSWPLLSKFRGEDVPDGDLACVDRSGVFLDPGRGELGDRVSMLYTPLADLPSSWVA